MSKVIPTPYVWTFQPQSGHAAGASQDYSTRMNWLSAGPSMIGKVNGIREFRNQLLMKQAAITETPRLVKNPPTWPASLLPQEWQPPKVIELPRNERLDMSMSNSGAQLAGGGRVYCSSSAHRGSINRETLSGSGIQLSEDHLSARYLRPDGVFQIAGGGLSSYDPTRQFLTLQASSSQPRSGGIGSVQFVHEFVPTVYLNPFSGPPGSYPDAFISNYDVVTNSVDGYSG